MPSRWIRWEPSTHIYEYSTDFAASWNPLPLNAAILTEGVIDAARFPATIPKLDIGNIWTGTNVISNAAPTLRWNETDAPVDSKNWEIIADAQVFKIRTANDVLNTFADVLAINRSNNSLVVSHPAAASNSFSCAAAGSVGISIRSTNPGTGSYAQLVLANDVSAFACAMQMFSSGYTGSPEPDFASSLSIKAATVGGMSIVAQHASGGIRFYTGGSAAKRLEITSAGNAVFSGTVTTKGRAIADGVWTAVPHSTSNFTASTGAWTVDAADQIHVRYTYLSGNSMLVSFDIRASSVSAVTSYLYLRVPDGKSSLGSSNGGGVGSNNGVTVPIGVYGLAGAVIYITPGPVGATWAISANNTSVGGSIILDVN